MKLPGNMQSMMKQAQQMQQRMQEEIAQIRVEATAGGGMVTVKMDGKKNVTAVTIDQEVAGDVEMLQDMVMAAFSYGPWIGYWSGFYAAQDLGCLVFPVGGLSTDQPLRRVLRCGCELGFGVAPQLHQRDVKNRRQKQTE